MTCQVAESEAVLACRLISRKTEPLDKMITRVQTARQEMRHLRDFNYGATCMPFPARRYVISQSS